MRNLVILFFLFVEIVISQTYTDIGGTILGIQYGSSVFGDIDKDGDLDLALAGQSSSGNIAKIYKNTDGTFSEFVSLTGVKYSSISFGDIDKDGDLDVFLSGNTSGTTYIAKIYRNDDTAFTDIAANLTGVANISCNSSMFFDYDNDGDLDLLYMGLSSSGNITKLYKNSNSSFTIDTNSTFTAVTNGAVASGDYDKDGDLDILISGNTGSSDVTKLYKNTDGEFAVATGVSFTGVQKGNVAFGDYDSDGDLDILISGSNTSSGNITKLYKNTDGVFAEFSAGLIGVSNSSVAFGDIENDGDLDILVSGSSSSGVVSKIYRNATDTNEVITFTDISASITGVNYSASSFGDYNGDGDLDIIIAGLSSGATKITKIYSCSGVAQNTIPNAPTSLSDSTFGFSVKLNWAKSTDVETPQDALTYNVRVGSTNGSSDIYSSMSNSNGTRQIVKFGNHTTNLILNNLSASGTIYWSVQAIDNSFAGSSFAESDSFYFNLPPVANDTTFSMEEDTELEFTLSVYEPNNDELTYTIIPSDSLHGPFHGTLIDSLIPTLTYTPNSNYKGSDTITYIVSDGLYSDTANIFIVVNAQSPFLESGFTIASLCSTASVFGDIDEDGDLDLFIAGRSDSTTVVSKIYRNDDSTFTDIEATIDGIVNGDAAFGDYDSDGDLDLAISGSSSNEAVSKIYRNDDSTFTATSDDIMGLSQSSVAFGDVDNDGSLEFLISGYDVNNDDDIFLVYKYDGNNFIASDTLSTSIKDGSISLGDYDGDSDLDILLTGNTGSSKVSVLLINTNGEFLQVEDGFTSLSNGEGMFGDYDNDGDLDIIISGNTNSSRATKIYKNSNNDYSAVTSSVANFGNSSSAFGDVDNDGDIDFVIAGKTSSTTASTSVYVNNNGTFVTLSASLENIYDGKVLFVDYDSDNDLDLFVSGKKNDSTYVSKIYRNTSEILNFSPSVPDGLNFIVVGDKITLSWDKSTDDFTNNNSISYNIRVGSSTGAIDVVNPMANTTNGKRLLTQFGNSGIENTFVIPVATIDTTATYYWSVQAIDNSNASSNFADEVTFNYSNASLQFRTFKADTSLSRKPVKLKAAKDGTMPLPTLGNVRDTIVKKAGKLIVGISQSHKDSIKKYGWLEWKKGADLGKFYTSSHSGTSYSLDSIRTSGKKSKKIVKAYKAERKSYNNPLAAELAAFKLNLLGSTQKVLPSGFASLKVNFEGTPYHDLTLGELADKLDTAMTYYNQWEQYSLIVDLLDPFAAEEIMNLIKTINDGFFDALNNADEDVASTSPLVLKGGKNISEVPYVAPGDTAKGNWAWLDLVESIDCFELQQNYPNPFNPKTTISFSISSSSFVTLKIYNVIGQEVATLLDNSLIEDGNHQIVFDANNLSSGIYFARISVTNEETEFTEIRNSKMLLMK